MSNGSGVSRGKRDQREYQTSSPTSCAELVHHVPGPHWHSRYVSVTLDSVAGARRCCWAAALPVVFCCLSATAHARDAVVRSFDGTPIVVHFYEAAGQSAGQRAPSVLVGPGFPDRGNTDPSRSVSDIVGVTKLRGAGYNAITWDPRGLGGSGGTVMFDSAGFEGRDVMAIVDWVAHQPEALLDGPGDPRVGMSGSSYGGAIQFVSAAIDRRIDAIVPDVAWHSLDSSLFPDGASKLAWLTLICGGGVQKGVLDGLLFGPAGVQVGSVDTHLAIACVEGIALGTASAGSRRWLADRGPGALLSQIRAPTLITQGTPDLLFPIDEAIANYEALRANNVPLKMIWHCGGHGSSATGGGDPGHLSRAGLAWFDRWLKRDSSIDTGAPFEWVSDDGRNRAGPDYPLAPAGTVDAAGAGSLLVTPLETLTSGLLASGALSAARPASNAVNVTFPLAPAGSDLIGAPTMKLTYRGTAIPAKTFLYAQVVNDESGQVLGGQATPIPVVLDGRTRTIERPLEVIAAHSDGAVPYRLQVSPASSLYSGQRSTGTVSLSQIAASLPLVDATRSARAAPTVARRIPRRLRITVRSLRKGRYSRVTLLSRLRSKPCSGNVAFLVRAGGLSRKRTARVRNTCRVRTTLRLRVRRGSPAKVAARYEGNTVLAPRRAHAVTRRLR